MDAYGDFVVHLVTLVFCRPIFMAVRHARQIRLFNFVRFAGICVATGYEQTRTGPGSTQVLGLPSRAELPG